MCTTLFVVLKVFGRLKLNNVLNFGSVCFFEPSILRMIPAGSKFDLVGTLRGQDSVVGMQYLRNKFTIK